MFLISISARPIFILTEYADMHIYKGYFCSMRIYCFMFCTTLNDVICMYSHRKSAKVV